MLGPGRHVQRRGSRSGVKACAGNVGGHDGDHGHGHAFGQRARRQGHRSAENGAVGVGNFDQSVFVGSNQPGSAAGRFGRSLDAVQRQIDAID